MVDGRVFHKTGSALLNDRVLPTEWLSFAQLASGHLPTSVIELARILVGGLQCTQAQVRLVPCTLG